MQSDEVRVLERKIQLPFLGGRVRVRVIGVGSGLRVTVTI